MEIGVLALSRSPFARMLAVLVVEYLIRKGFIASEDASQAVEDAVNIIGFVAMTVTLLIWQWRTHHPAKAHLDVQMPVTPQEVQQIEKVKVNYVEKIKAFLNRLLFTPKPEEPKQDIQ